MTASELARLMGARRCGKHRWVARCPAHDDRTPSLSIAVGRKVPVVIKCMSAGCDLKSIIGAAGLKWEDILGPRAITPEVRQRLRDDERLKKVELYWSAFLLNKVVLDTENRDYWARQQWRAEQEIRNLREKANPKLKAVREFQEKVKRMGWDAIWNEFLTSEKGKAANDKYGIDRTGASAGASPGDVRAHGIHGKSPELSPGGVQEG